MPVFEKKYRGYQIFSNTLSLKISKRSKNGNLWENNDLDCLKIDFRNKLA